MLRKRRWPYRIWIAVDSTGFYAVQVALIRAVLQSVKHQHIRSAQAMIKTQNDKSQLKKMMKMGNHKSDLANDGAVRSLDMSISIWD